ncbi:MAG: hypothetical protein ACT4ON_03875 [Bacteroidota bacterium]
MNKLFIVILVLFLGHLNAQNVLDSGISKLNLTGCCINGGAIEITGNGNTQQHKAYYSSETVLEEIDQVYDVKIISLDVNGIFKFGIGKQAYLAGTYVEFFGNDSSTSILVYRMDNTTLLFEKRYELPFKISLGQTYTIRIAKRIKNLIFEISNTTTTDHYLNDSLSYPTPFFGALWGVPFIACHSGTISVSEFSLTTPFNKSPRLSVLGDSFIEVSNISFTGNQLVIEKGELHSGIYFLQVVSANGMIANQKIVIQ